jgi:toxin ParE1/3/4
VNVRYTRRALAQIDRTLTYVETRSPQGATRLRDQIVALIALLQEHPYAGRATSRPNVRRLSIIPFPYFIDYQARATEIVIMRFRHTAHRPVDI